MADSLRQFRRNATQLALRNALAATAPLPIGLQRSLALAAASLACTSPLRQRVRENMRLAFGPSLPAGAPRRYFRRLGWLFSNALTTLHHGLDASRVPDELTFDATASVLDDAMAQGRGAILTTPHWVGHELAGGMITRRQTLVMLVREASTPQRTDLKLKWYRSIGVETVLRPRQSSMFEDAKACLRVLKGGRMLAITPDLLAGPGQGVDVTVFGRDLRLQGGAFALASMARSPIVRTSPRWLSDNRVIVQFSQGAQPPEGSSRDATMHFGLQDWCNWLEAHLRVHPEDWLFWLDKSWSRALRSVPRTDEAA